jgi:hypothetical protein
VLLLFNLLAEFQQAAGLPLYRGPATIRTQVLRSDPRPGGASCGASSVPKLGWIESQKPFAGQHLEWANSNFAEVGNGTRNLISDGTKTTLQSREEDVDQGVTSEFRIVALEPIATAPA